MMKTIKFTLLTIALAVSAMGFAQKNGAAFSLNGKTVLNPYASHIQKDKRDKLNMQMPEKQNDKHKQAFEKIMKKQVSAFNKTENQSFRAETADKQCLDSIIDIYDESGYYKEVYSYNSKGYVLEQISYFRENLDDEWEMNSKINYEYGDNEYQTKVVHYYWNWVDSEWEASYMEDYTYDKNGNITSYIYNDWDGTAWEKVEKQEYTYDDLSLTTGYSAYSWNGADWDEEYRIKVDYTFNAAGYPEEGLGYIFWEGDWVLGMKSLFEFDSNGNHTKYIEFSLNEDMDWEENSITEYIYDADGNLITEIYFGMEDGTLYGEKFVYTYDANGNITVFLLQISDNGGTDWVDSYKYEYTYDLSISRTDLFFPIYYFLDGVDFAMDNIKNMRVTSKSYSTYDYENDTYGGDWLSQDITTYYWSKANFVSNAVIKGESSSLIIYPNPTNGQLRITNYELRNSKAEIFDVLGRSLKMENVNDGTINISHLPAGLYFLKIGKETVKIIKK